VALSAVFSADFSQFEKSINDAAVHLQVFDRGVKTASRDMTRALESFSGQKVAKEISLLSETMKRLGGEAGIAGGLLKLSDSELRRVSASANEAMQKFARLGESAPASIRQLHAEIAKLPKPVNESASGFSSLSGIVGKLGPLLPVASIAGAGTALIGMGKAALASAGEIKDLSDKTGFSVRAIQEMQAVASATGATVETFSQAAFRLGVNVAEGTTKARDAVAGLGLSYAELRAMKPEEQFRAVMAALSDVESVQERNRLGVALFGKQFSEMTVATVDNYDRIASSARVSSDAQIEALDAASKRWDKFVLDFATRRRSILGNIVTGLQTPTDIRELTDAQRQILTEGIKNGENLILVMQRVRGVIPESLNLPGASADQAGAMRDYVKELSAVLVKVRELDPAMKVQLDAAIKLDGATQEVADAFSLTSTELRIYGQHVQETAAKKKEVEAASKAAAKELAGFWKEVDRLNRGALPAFTGLLDKVSMDLGYVPPLLSDSSIQARAFGGALLQANEAGMGWAKANGLLDNLKQAEIGLGALIKQGLSGAIANIGETFVRAFTGGGGLMGAVKAIGVQLGEAIARPIFDSISNAIAKALASKAAGSIASSIVGGGDEGESEGGSTAKTIGKYAAYASVVGAVGIGIFKLIQHNRNLNKEVEKWNAEIQKVRGSLLETHGSLAALEQKARAVGLSFFNEWGHQGEEGLRLFNDFIKAFEARLEATNTKFEPLLQSATELGVRLPAALLESIQHFAELGVITEENAELLRSLTDRAEIDWAKMQDAAERYGIDIASLGDQFQRLRLGDAAQAIINDFDLMSRGGADVGGVLFGMQDEISSLVQQAKKFGLEIPQNMQPWIEELQRAGLLVDENGDALKDLGGVKFGERVATEIERITDALSDLVATLNRVADGLGNLTAPGLTVPGGGAPAGGAPESPVFVSRGGYVTGHGVEYFGGGGFVPRGTDTVPAMLTPGEMVVSASDTKHFLRSLRDGTLGNGGESTVHHVRVDVDGHKLTDFVIDTVGRRLRVRGGA
jgi:hypothetical protein